MVAWIALILGIVNLVVALSSTVIGTSRVPTIKIVLERDKEGDNATSR